MTRTKRLSILALGLLLALAVGCKKSKAPAPKAPAQAAAAKQAAAPKVKAAPITVPEIAAPEATGQRVVHLVYTSNNDGEIEPCG